MPAPSFSCLGKGSVAFGASPHDEGLRDVVRCYNCLLGFIGFDVFQIILGRGEALMPEFQHDRHERDSGKVAP